MFTNSHRIYGAEATLKATTTALSQPNQLFHFTGHGNYNFNSPKHSALALTRQESLTVERILQIPFPRDSYKIITLSACETALTGNQSITTEYVGLVSGFLRWGASYVLSTQWLVEEKSSAVVMIKFYHLLLVEKLAPPLAFAKTIQWLRIVTVQELQQFYQELHGRLPNESEIHAALRDEISNVLKRRNATKTPYSDPYHWAAYKLTGKM
jgi:CHAT domain-containing protein